MENTLKTSKIWALGLWAVWGLLVCWPAGAVEILTLDACLEIAERVHPDLAGAEAQTQIERGRLKQSAVSDRLEVAANASVNRVGTEQGTSDRYSVGGSASLKVYDAGRTRHAVLSQRETLSAAEESAGDKHLQVRTNVRRAYMTLLLNQAVKKQREESVSAFKRHLERARGFFEVGTRARFDVTKAEVDLGKAQLALVEAQSDIDIARHALLNAMGVPDRPAFEVAMTHWDVPQGSESEAERLALETRRDYKAFSLKTLAATHALRAEARYASPTVSVKGGYSGDGERLSDLNAGWNVSLNVSIPVVDGGATKARVEIASGQLQSLQAAQESLRQSILLEVRKAVLSVTTARERIRITELTVAQAVENHELAEGRYATGISDALEVTDALLALTDAHLSAYRAKYDLQAALIDLEKAVGAELKKSQTGGRTE